MAFDKQASTIHRSSKRSLVEFINGTFNINLNHDEVIIGTPIPVVGSYREGQTERNTLVRVTAKEASNYQDTIVVAYDRLQLADLNKLLDFRVKGYNLVNTHDLIPLIWRRFGIILDTEDIIDEPLSNHQTEEGLPPIYKLRAQPEALGWLGECLVTVEEGDAVLSEYVDDSELNGLNYPDNDDGANGSAIVYMYGYDFTDYKHVLETYPVDLVLDDTSTDILEAVKAIDEGNGKNAWNLTEGDTSWSLFGATVIYNGPNDPSLPTNPKYKYVLGLQLREDLVVPPGVMYLHYDDPLDPSLVVQPDGDVEV